MMKRNGPMRSHHVMRMKMILRVMRMKSYPMSGLSYCGLRCTGCAPRDCGCGYHVRKSRRATRCCEMMRSYHCANCEIHWSRYGSCLMTFA